MERVKPQEIQEEEALKDVVTRTSPIVKVSADPIPGQQVFGFDELAQKTYELFPEALVVTQGASLDPKRNAAAIDNIPLLSLSENICHF